MLFKSGKLVLNVCVKVTKLAKLLCAKIHGLHEHSLPKCVDLKSVQLYTPVATCMYQMCHIPHQDVIESDRIKKNVCVCGEGRGDNNALLRVRTGYGILEKLWNFEKEIPYMEKLWNLSKMAVPKEKLRNFRFGEKKSVCFL